MKYHACAVLLYGAVCCAQSAPQELPRELPRDLPRDLKVTLANPDFAQGAPGVSPPGWSLSFGTLPYTAVRTEGDQGSARLVIRRHSRIAAADFIVSSRPIKSAAWSVYELHINIDVFAEDISVGLQLTGQGAAWIDNVSLDFAKPLVGDKPVIALAVSR